MVIGDVEPDIGALAMATGTICRAASHTFFTDCVQNLSGLMIMQAAIEKRGKELAGLVLVALGAGIFIAVDFKNTDKAEPP